MPSPASLAGPSHAGQSLLLGGVLLFLALGILARSAPGHAQPPPSATPLPSPTTTLEPGECRGWADKTASPRVWLGDTAAVTLTFRAECRGRLVREHVVLVFDASTALAGESEGQMKAAATQLVDRLRLPEYPETRVGVVAVNDMARTLSPVTNDEERVKSAIARVRFEGQAKVHLGLDEAMVALRRGFLEQPACHAKLRPPSRRLQLAPP